MNLKVIETKGLRVLTSKQLAQSYEVAERQIKQNFSNNRGRFIEGKHYIEITGDELKAFKNEVENFDLVGTRASHLYLWTEKGALLHAKSLNTDKAWEVYDYLVDFYFRVKGELRQQTSNEKQEIVPINTTVEKIPDKHEKKLKFEIPEMNNPILVLHTLLDLAETKNIKVRTLPLKANRSLLCANRIGISEALSLNEIIYELAYELAHKIIHYNAGDMINSPLRKYYDEQAERTASMMIEMINIKEVKLA